MHGARVLITAAAAGIGKTVIAAAFERAGAGVVLVNRAGIAVCGNLEALG